MSTNVYGTKWIDAGNTYWSAYQDYRYSRNTYARAIHGGTHSITTAKLFVNATNTNSYGPYSSYAAFSYGLSSTTIDASSLGKALTAEINANASRGSYANAYGMSSSTLKGSSLSDSIVVTAKSSANDKAWALNSSKIYSGPGDDSISLQADWTLNNSTVDLGSGDDLLVIDGRINTGTIKGGSGTDTVQLKGVKRSDVYIGGGKVGSPDGKAVSGALHYSDVEYFKLDDGLYDSDGFEVKASNTFSITDLQEDGNTVEGGVAKWQINRSGNTSGEGKVRFNTYSDKGLTVDGTPVDRADSGSDYVSTDMVVTFAPGETTKIIEVKTNDDEEYEPINESFKGKIEVIESGDTISGYNYDAVWIYDNEIENKKPIAPSTNLHGTEDTTVTITSTQLLAGWSDPENDPLSVTSLTTNSSDGTLKNNENSTWNFTPAENFNGTVSFNYTVSDGDSSTDARATLNIAAVNDAPVLTGTPASLPHGKEDQIYLLKSTDLLKGYSDIEGDAITISSLSTESDNGSLVDNKNGTWSFIPATNFNGSVHFNYVISDGDLSTNASVSLEFSAINDAPTLSGVPVSLPSGKEDSSYLLRATDLLKGYSDIDGDSLSISSITTSSSNGSVTNNGNNTWTFTPKANLSGDVVFGYVVSDGHLSTAATTSLHLDAANDAPILTGTPVALPNGTEDLAYVLKTSDLLKGYSDADGDSLSITSVTTASANGTITENGNGTWTYVPTTDLNGEVSFAFVVSDGNGGMTNGSTKLTLDAVDDLPPGVSIKGDDVVTDENGDTAVFLIQLNSAPVDPVTVNFSLTDTSEAQLSASSFTFTRTNWNQTQSLTVTGLEDNDIRDVSYDLRAFISTSDLVYKDITINSINLINRDNGAHAPIDLTGTNGVDYIDGAKGNDQLYGLGGSDRLRGFEGKDSLYGGSHGDQLLGGEGDDELYGESGNDTLTGGAGNDTIDGGAYGTDIAVFTGNLSDYRFREANGRVTAEDLRNASPDGTDTLVGIERVKFADQTVSMADAIRSTTPIVDANSDGFVDGVTNYQLFNDGSPIDLKNRRGKTYSDASTASWDAVKAVDNGSGFKVLLEGDATRDGQHYVWDVNSSGVITKGSGWKTTSQAVQAGWESTFGDINGDGIIGQPIADADSDGFVDGVTNYQLFNDGSPIDLKNRSGKTYSDSSTVNWDAAKAVDNGSGFKVLLEGDATRDGQHYVWDVNSSGVITKGSGWKTADQMTDAGFEGIFQVDFNGDGVI